MITRIELENFKSFKELKLDLQQLSILTGLNNSGKSSVLQALKMFGLGSTEVLPLPGHNTLRLLKSNLSKKDFFLIKVFSGETFSTLTVTITGDRIIGCERFNGTVTGLPNTYMYVTASRLGPIDTLPLNSFSHSDLGPNCEYIFDYLDNHSDSLIDERLVKAVNDVRLLRENVEAWLQLVSPGVSLRFDVNLKREEIYPYYNNIHPTETGFGLSYLLPVIVSLLIPAHDDVLMIENPEAHLHPKGQTEIGKLIALAASTGKQILVETHSDHVVDGIRIAVKNKTLPASNVGFYYFTRPDYESPSSVETISISPDGKLSQWPEGFFDQTLIDNMELV